MLIPITVIVSINNKFSIDSNLASLTLNLCSFEVSKFNTLIVVKSKLDFASDNAYKLERESNPVRVDSELLSGKARRLNSVIPVKSKAVMLEDLIAIW